MLIKSDSRRQCIRPLLIVESVLPSSFGKSLPNKSTMSVYSDNVTLNNFLLQTLLKYSIKDDFPTPGPPSSNIALSKYKALLNFFRFSRTNYDETLKNWSPFKRDSRNGSLSFEAETC